MKGFFRKLLQKEVSFLYDFNLFDENSIIINVGYTKTSISIGELLVVIPLGEFNFVDVLGNYLFNRILGELHLSNAALRRAGKRGKILDDCRASAARILFGRSRKISIPELSYERKVTEEEIDKVLSCITGNATYGDFVESVRDFSTSLVHSLYIYEELFKERFKVHSIGVIGRLRFPFVKILRRIFPIPVQEFSGKDLINLPAKKKISKVMLKKVTFDRALFRSYPIEVSVKDFNLSSLRTFFSKRDIRGIGVIEKLVSSDSLSESLIYELLNIIKRCSGRTKEEIAYLNSSIAALSRLDFEGKLFDKVKEELENKAYDWSLPIETKMNILFFCYKNRERLQNSVLSFFPFLMLTYLRNKKISEGERNFVRTVAENFFKI